MASENEKIPQTAEEYRKRGVSRYKARDFVGAVEDYTEALRLEPGNIHLHIGRGIVWSGLGEHDKAIDDYSTAIHLNRNEFNAWSCRGKARIEKGEHDKALFDFNEAIRLQPNDEALLYHRSNIWLRKGEFEKAIDDCDAALRLHPSYQKAIDNRNSAIALRTMKIEGEKFGERMKEEYNKRLEKELESAVKQITEDQTEFRDAYKSNLKYSRWLRITTIVFSIAIGLGVIGFFWFIYHMEKDSLGGWKLVPWIPVVTAISVPFIAAWWILQRWSFELKTLAYGFHRKAILEERILLFFRSDREWLRDLQKIYVIHWMEKSPLEVMLAIGGKGKSMGGANSPTTALLESAENIFEKADKSNR